MSKTTRSDGSPAFDRSSATGFGYSLEGKAQIEDAASRSSPVPGRGQKLNLYRLIPAASPEGPRGQNAPYQWEVIVAARTTGDARVVASGRELDFMEFDSAPAEDVTTVNAGAFSDEKLYMVIEIETARTDPQHGVLEGMISVDNIRPTETWFLKENLRPALALVVTWLAQPKLNLGVDC